MRGVLATGLRSVRVEIGTDGRIIVSAATSDDSKPESSYTAQVNEWDEVLKRRP